MRNHILSILTGLLTLTLLGMVAGCSTDNPIESTEDNLSSVPNNIFLTVSPPCEKIQFTAHVAEIDTDARVLTFDEVTHVVSVPEECTIVSVKGGEETPMALEDLVVGDLIKVCGVVQEDETVKANKIVVYYGGECYGYDVIFQDSIATIDYGAQSFTVYGRTETIIIDETTVIWGKIPYQLSPGPEADKESYGPDSDLGSGENLAQLRYRNAVDTIFTFLDLQPGYTLEVKANIVDENTLLAINIKVLGSNYKKSILFEDYLASVDCETRIVTFENEAWIGQLCPGAALLDSDGEAVMCEDFTVGGLVAVRGVAITEDTLRVCELTGL